MYGNYVSHNSYNSPFEVNTFKWDNKKSITVTGEKDGTEFSSTITNAEFNYCDSFASLIKMHKGIEKVRSTSSTKTIYDVMGDLGSRWWSRNGQDDLSNCIAIRMNKTLIFAAVGPISIGADNEYLGCNPDELDTALFEYGAKEWKDTYHLFPKDYNMILVSKTK